MKRKVWSFQDALNRSALTFATAGARIIDKCPSSARAVGFEMLASVMNPHLACAALKQVHVGLGAVFQPPRHEADGAVLAFDENSFAELSVNEEVGRAKTEESSNGSDSTCHEQ